MILETKPILLANVSRSAGTPARDTETWRMAARVVVQKSAWRCVSHFFHVVRLPTIFFRLANIRWFDFDLDVWDQIGRMLIFGFP